ANNDEDNEPFDKTELYNLYWNTNDTEDKNYWKAVNEEVL
ncbi:17817_t:CDS:1, partial [Racocetra fulgida]